MALKIILGSEYKNYKNAMNSLELETLKERREQLCLDFARKCLKNPKMKHFFAPNNRTHTMIPRNHEHYQVTRANTNRESPIIYMQNILNNDIRRRSELNNLWNN